MKLNKYFLMILSFFIILSAYSSFKWYTAVVSKIEPNFQASQANYFYDSNNVRYTLVSTRGGKALNWIFLPGGPGGDSSYLSDLVNMLELEGNTWLVDLPGNGSNNVKIESFEEWFTIFIPTIKKFSNPVIVGHSFGGMLSLLCSELETLLKGLVILNSTPSMWLEESSKVAKQRKLPDFSKDMQTFFNNPNDDSCKKVLNACTPYYFPEKSIEAGRKFLSQIPFAFQPALWWIRKVVKVPYKATWIPQNVQTLIIGGELDAMCPFSLFEKDERFDRGNIKKVLIKDAGHLPWFESPGNIKKLFKEFEKNL